MADIYFGKYKWHGRCGRGWKRKEGSITLIGVLLAAIEELQKWVVELYFGRWKGRYVAPLCCALEEVAHSLQKRGARYRARRFQEEARFLSRY